MKEKTLPVVELFSRVLLRRDHEDLSPLPSISSQIGHFIKWKHAKRRTALLHEARYLLLGLVSLAAVTGLYFFWTRLSSQRPSPIWSYLFYCPL
jgi:hypothetical protein